jgi:hypothetical protein
MPFIDFPNVPNVAGVPALLRSVTVPTPQVLEVGALGALTSLLGFGPPVWGVFDLSGNKVLDPDSFLSFEYRNQARVSDYPQEQGAFSTYNKVQTPFDVRVRMAVGSDQASREAFLAKVDSMLKSIELFNVVTPEATYVNTTLEAYDYRRQTTNGATLLIVDLAFLEVRVTATAQFSAAASSNPLPADQVKSPSGADPISDGQVQASAPTVQPATLFGPLGGFS